LSSVLTAFVLLLVAPMALFKSALLTSLGAPSLPFCPSAPFDSCGVSKMKCSMRPVTCSVTLAGSPGLTMFTASTCAAVTARVLLIRLNSDWSCSRITCDSSGEFGSGSLES